MDAQKLFGSGPLCFIVGAVTLWAFYSVEYLFKISKLPISASLANVIFAVAIALTFWLAVWGFLSLPVNKRGKEVVTDKAFKYFRHPIYAAFLDFFIFGLGFYLKSFGILMAGIILIFICGKLVEKEENYLIKRFGQKYIDYQKKTKKFIPQIY